jgi:hypothetical protein
MRMDATHFLMMKRLLEVVTEMGLHVLAYNLTRVMNIMGIQSLIAAMSVPHAEDHATPRACSLREKRPSGTGSRVTSDLRSQWFLYD